MRIPVPAGLVAVLLAGAALAVDPPKAAEVSLEPVKWPQLEQILAGHKGKVVVLDVWAEY
jgi:hypothetical protein